MLLNPSRKSFRICAAGDADAGNSLTAPQIAALGYTLAAGATGLVPYGAAGDAGAITKNVATPSTSSGWTSINYTRTAGPVDVPIALAISVVLLGYANLNMVEGPAVPAGNQNQYWAAGTITGEANIPAALWDKSTASSGMPTPARGTTALPAGAWIDDV